MNQNEKKTNTLAILGFVFSFFIAIVGLVLSILGLNKSKETGSGKGFSIAGIIISSVSIVISIIIMIFAPYYLKYDRGIIDNKEENTKYGSEYYASEIDKIIGDYEFNEYTEPNQNRIYILNVYKENNLYYANLNIDGFQTMYRMKLIIKYVSNHYVFELNEDLGSSYNNVYNIGDNLFELYEKDDSYYTKWISMKPMLSSNNEDGIYFKKEY